MLALLLVLAVTGVSGCNSDDDSAKNEADPIGAETTNDDAAASDDAEDDSGSGGDTLSTEMEEGAIDIAGAYFVANTDFTKDQFDWKVEAAAQDNDGQWWARVSVTPKDDMSLDTLQVYVYSPSGSDFWFAHDMGTGIDPSTDDSFPEEVRDQL